MLEEKQLQLSSARVAALAEELGEFLSPERLVRQLKLASRREFVEAAIRAAVVVGDVDTSKINMRTKMFIALLYHKPPRLALVQARLHNSTGELVVGFPEEGVQERIQVDPLAPLLGPSRKTVEKLKIDVGVVAGPWIPVAARYLVAIRTLRIGKQAKPTLTIIHPVKKIYIYKSLGDKIPTAAYNLLHLISYS